MTPKTLIKLASLFALFNPAASLTASVNLKPDVTISSNTSINGVIHLEQNSSSDNLTLIVAISGLEPNTEHGWHIHELPVTNNNCTSTGGHYNPMNTTHGGPTSNVRHIGDFGNFQTNELGIAVFNYTDRLATLYGNFSAIGRSISIHSMRDDLGLGVNAASLVNGNSGPRILCGDIVAQKDSISGSGGLHSIGNQIVAFFGFLIVSLML